MSLKFVKSVVVKIGKFRAIEMPCVNCRYLLGSLPQFKNSQHEATMRPTGPLAYARIRNSSPGKVGTDRNPRIAKEILADLKLPASVRKKTSFPPLKIRRQPSVSGHR